MNYRHIYHAGNFADVIKHLLLIAVIDRLKLKETPFFAMDTHAGIGLYDLTSEQAQKTKEADAGILSLLQADIKNQDIIDYLNIVKSFNTEDKLDVYPGSPAIISHVMRQHDRFTACELHPTDYHTLSNNWRTFPHKINAMNMDGYEALKANLPPKERRGVVLIDPPFEERDEFATLAENLKMAMKKWHNGVYVIWFPIKAHLPIEKFYNDVIAMNVDKTLLVECWITDKKEPETLNGCGLIVMNTPYLLDERIRQMTPELNLHICPNGTPGIEVKWLVKPTDV